MMHPFSWRLGFLLAASFAFFSAPVRSQDQKAPDPGQAKALRHEVSVVLKLIQVSVTGKDGQPVVDLKREDFSLEDNGQPQTITDFERRDFKVPGRGRAAAAATPPERVLLPRKFFLFFDFAHSDPQGIRAFRRMALDFIDQRTLPTDEIGLASYSDLKRLQIQLFLTNDRKKARDLVSRIGLSKAAEREESTEESRQRDLAGGGSADARAPSDSSLPFPQPSEYNSDPLDRMKATYYVGGLLAFAHALRSVPGTKNLIFFSGGIVGSPRFLPGQLAEMRFPFEQLLKELATSNVLVFPVYANPRSDAPESQTGVVMLRRLADSTGGRYLGGFETYKERVEVVQNMTEAYYVLGFRIDERWDGRYHKIRVEVNRPGCKVTAQRGYLSPKVFADYTELEKAIQLIDLALAETPLSQAPIRFPMAAWPVAEGKVAVMGEIPLAELRREMGDRVEVLRLTFSTADEMIDRQSTEENPAAWRGPSVRLAAILNGSSGRVKCRFIIRDLETGRAAVAGVSTELPVADEKEIRILTPVFLSPESGVHFLGQPPVKLKPAETAPPPLAEILGFEPLEYSSEDVTTLKKASRVKGAIACLGPASLPAGLRLSASLFDSLKQEMIPVPLSVLKESGAAGLRVFFFEMEIPDVEPDEYRLFLVVENGQGSVTRIARDFVVE